MFFVSSKSPSFWLVFELDFYQGRYIINDLLDKGSDGYHTYAEQRARISIRRGESYDIKRVYAVAASVLIRTAIFIGAAILLWAPTGVALAVAAAAVIVDSIVYEWLRARTQRTLTTAARRIALVSWSIYLVVGVGYVIRTGLGLWLGSTGLDTSIVVWALVSVWLLGIMFVTMTWVLEAASLTADHPTLNAKFHLDRLMRMANLESLSDADEAAARRPLQAPTRQFCAVWDFAFVGCCAAMAALAVAIAEPSPVIGGVLVGTTTILAVVATRLGTGQRWFMVTLGSLIALPCAILAVGSTGSWYAAGLLLIPALHYAFFRAASYRDIFLDPSQLALAAQVAFDRFALRLAGLDRDNDGILVPRQRRHESTEQNDVVI